MKKVAVLQSNYLPWKGYFDIIHDVDLFLFYDEVQYTKHDWRNRNKIKTKDGIQWLTIPVGPKENYCIAEIQLTCLQKWQKKHWDRLRHVYANAPFFHLYKDFFEDVYLGRQWQYLYELNRYLITNISKFLKIETTFADSRSFPSIGKKHLKLLQIVEQSEAEVYITGPGTKDYLIVDDYAKKNIKVVFKDYQGYPEYHQAFGKFVHEVSIVDLLFNTGSDAPYYIWKWRDQLSKQK